ncbi:uncharacterized protein LOC143913110 [Arctopsyche grandis]|uniref:uncharacterized protein LOC143913110 n=1 Tax=Arctopsyche grandis TaxID=121162 RepID=UPI00406D7714
MKWNRKIIVCYSTIRVATGGTRRVERVNLLLNLMIVARHSALRQSWSESQLCRTVSFYVMRLSRSALCLIQFHTNNIWSRTVVSGRIVRLTHSAVRPLGVILLSSDDCPQTILNNFSISRI